MTQIRPSADYYSGSDFLVLADRALPLLTRLGIYAELSIFYFGQITVSIGLITGASGRSWFLLEDATDFKTF
jgi:hypothetical protein